MTRHLLTPWNPSYAEDALDAHLRVLLRWAELRGIVELRNPAAHSAAVSREQVEGDRAWWEWGVRGCW